MRTSGRGRGGGSGGARLKLVGERPCGKTALGWTRRIQEKNSKHVRTFPSKNQKWPSFIRSRISVDSVWTLYGGVVTDNKEPPERIVGQPKPFKIVISVPEASNTTANVARCARTLRVDTPRARPYVLLWTQDDDVKVSKSGRPLETLVSFP